MQILKKFNWVLPIFPFCLGTMTKASLNFYRFHVTIYMVSVGGFMFHTSLFHSYLTSIHLQNHLINVFVTKCCFGIFSFFLVRNRIKFLWNCDHSISWNNLTIVIKILSLPQWCIFTTYYVVKMAILPKTDKNIFWWISKCQHCIQYLWLRP